MHTFLLLAFGFKHFVTHCIRGKLGWDSTPSTSAVPLFSALVALLVSTSLWMHHSPNRVDCYPRLLSCTHRTPSRMKRTEGRPWFRLMSAQNKRIKASVFGWMAGCIICAGRIQWSWTQQACVVVQELLQKLQEHAWWLTCLFEEVTGLCVGTEERAGQKTRKTLSWTPQKCMKGWFMISNLDASVTVVTRKWELMKHNL